VAGDGGHGDAAGDDAKDDSHDEESSGDDGDEDVAEGRDNAAFGLALAAFVISLLVMFRTTMGKRNKKD
jgi:hypothetical protein